jgi:hypothetical protein
MGKENRMAKFAASFEQEQADAVVSELGRMRVDGLKWSVDDAGDQAGVDVPVAVVPVGAAGNGAAAANGGPAVAAPFLAAGENATSANSDEAAYLRQARRGGATIITVDAPAEVEAIVREIFERHSASNVVTK